MSAVALAAPQAAPHTPPHPAAAGVRPRAGGLTVRVPLRLVAGSQYPDAALAVYVKIAALALRPEGCTARVSTLATYLGMSKSAVERGLKALRNPDPVDGIVEVPTVRRTARGGTGESAHRTVRPIAGRELWVRIPVRAAEALTPRLLRVYALLAYATARHLPVSTTELGEMLHHHTGEKAGQHLTEMSARRLVDELEDTGWLTVRRREGAQGRHAYETNRTPLHPVPTPAAIPVLEDQEPEQLALFDEAGAPFVHDGSGPSDHDGSLASKEDHLTDRPEKPQLSGGVRRRRGDRKWVAAPVDNRVPDTFRPAGSRAARGNRPPLPPAHDHTPDRPGAYTGPELRWTKRIHEALAPVRHELDSIRTFVLRRLAREIGRQLDEGITPDRMAARIQARYRRISPTDIRDMGAWLLTVGIVRPGCDDPRCEDGVIWGTDPDDHEAGGACRTCAHQKEATAAWWRYTRDLEARLQQLRTQSLDERLQEQRAETEERRRYRAAGRARAQQLLELGDKPLPRPSAALPKTDELPPVQPLPPKKTFRQRDAASDEEILAAVAEHGEAVALHIYGHLRTLPLLHGRPRREDT
ncbi:helix-turn-helix domain-containing protein [Streptomyces olivaceus]|uniref:helix-turn-helix domain-containing protein n=1 Tax=Streptomyces olivaceus TaxID=47716 RepID=UPI001CCB0578|nr:helix-turn-helix domain-containing protein [Streptomyces olivaceus]MBZ6258817.1 helix-turn-helix domain-containing protein [Streptomyces olivaceus]